MIAYFQKADKMIDSLRNIADKVGAPLLDLTIRLYIARIFFQSGWLKFQNFLNHDWGSTVYLFQDIHPVPGIPAGMAAVAGTTGELALSTLLALGFFGRFAAAGLIVMTLIFQFVVLAEYGIANPVHYLWIMLLGVILVNGPGTISIDHFLRHWLYRRG